MSLRPWSIGPQHSAKNREPQVLTRFDRDPSERRVGESIMVRSKAVLTGLHIFKDEVASCIGGHRALCVLVRTVQYDLSVGDDCAGVVSDDPSYTAECGCPRAGTTAPKNNPKTETGSICQETTSRIDQSHLAFETRVEFVCRSL
jgi:hypothetical protein